MIDKNSKVWQDTRARLLEGLAEPDEQERERNLDTLTFLMMTAPKPLIMEFQGIGAFNPRGSKEG